MGSRLPIITTAAAHQRKKPETTIGFFYIFLSLRTKFLERFLGKEILSGMLGADLLGFHTYDYERHFLSSVKRILRLDVNFNTISYQDRIITVDSFPMGMITISFIKLL